jgi:hypothetical protein
MGARLRSRLSETTKEKNMRRRKKGDKRNEKEK